MIDSTKYKQTLEQMLAEVVSELKTIGIHDPENETNWVAVPDGVDVSKADQNVVADQVEDWDERRSTIAVLETRYNNVRRALKKIEAGTYGICELSGQPIETKRLDANPAARTNLAHRDEEEKLPR